VLARRAKSALATESWVATWKIENISRDELAADPATRSEVPRLTHRWFRIPICPAN